MRRATLIAIVALVVGLGAGACGNGDDAADDTTPIEDTMTQETTDTGETDGAPVAAGREIFVANCGTCHTLAAAGTTGTLAPPLDGASVGVEDAEDQVRNGGGGMPAYEDVLSDEEIEQVAEYVAEASG